MKKLILVAAIFPLFSFAAFAADLPNTKGAPAFAPPPPPQFTWTGFYIGGQVGYQWGESRDPYVFNLANPSIRTPQPFLSHDDRGVVGGTHAGYNYQISQFVFGVEGDIDGSNYDGSTTLSGPGGVQESTRIGAQGSFRGRVGFAWDRILFYGTGGVAFASIRGSLTNLPANITDTGTDGRVGWTGGGGIEYAVDNDWSIRAEYRYSDFGRAVYDIPDVLGIGIGYSKHITTSQATVGFSYKFDFAPPGPIAAKY